MMVFFLFFVMCSFLASVVNARQIKPEDVVKYVEEGEELHQLSDRFHLNLRIRSCPWTHQEIIQLQSFLHVDNILDGNTILEVLLANNNQCKALYTQRYDLYKVFVNVIKEVLLPFPQMVVVLPTMVKYALRAVLDTEEVNPQPKLSIQEQYLWPALQWYMLSGKQYFESFKLLLDRGAKPDFIAYNGACTAMDLSLWEFWNNGEAVVRLLLEKGADPNMICPGNINPCYIPSNQWPRKLYIGYFMGHTRLTIALISAVEQLYYAVVFDPAKGRYDRTRYAATCIKLADLLKTYGAKDSPKAELQKTLDEVASTVAKIYNHPVNQALSNQINSIVNYYGT